MEFIDVQNTTSVNSVNSVLTDDLHGLYVPVDVCLPQEYPLLPRLHSDNQVFLNSLP